MIFDVLSEIVKNHTEVISNCTRVIHAFAHETLDLKFSKASRPKIKLKLHFIREIFALSEYNIS